MIGLLKRPLLIWQSGWEEIRNAYGNWLSPLGAENKYFGTVSQTLLTGVRSRLRSRLANIQQDRLWVLNTRFHFLESVWVKLSKAGFERQFVQINGPESPEVVPVFASVWISFYYPRLRFYSFYFRSAFLRQKKRSLENENAFSCLGLIYWPLEHQLHRVLRVLIFFSVSTSLLFNIFQLSKQG